MLQIVIPFYKNHKQLEKCKQHIKSSGVSTQLIIIDNSEDNTGFTRAVNKGLIESMKSAGEYVMVINQDLYLEPQAIPEMIKFLDENKEFGLVAPLQAKDGKVICGGGEKMFPTGFNFCGTLADFKDPYSVTWVEAACWMIRKDMIREIGVLDKNMVMFYSDSDYCLRARMANWVIGMVPTAVCEHERGCTKEGAASHIEKQKAHDGTYWHAKWMTDQMFKILEHKPHCAPRQILGKSFMREEDE